MNMYKKGLTVLLALAAGVSLTGCVSSASAAEQDVNIKLLVVATVESTSCKMIEDLNSAVTFVASASDKQIAEIVEMNEKGFKIEDLESALDNKVTECEKSSENSDTPAPAVSTPSIEDNLSPAKGADVVPVPEYVIAMPDRANGRLNAAGVTDPGNVDAFRAQILDQAKHDPLTLYFYYMASPFGDVAPLANELIIAEGGLAQNGNVYSSEGIRLYEEWAAFWTSPATRITAVNEIKFQGNNTGSSATNTPTTSAGVTGDDKSGYDVEYLNAQSETTKEHSSLNRCTQVTTAQPITNVPQGLTDNPIVENPPTELAPKVQSQNVGSNTAVAPHARDNTGGNAAAGHQVSNADGNTVSNGVQESAAANAAAAAKAVADAAAANKANADAAAAAQAAANASGGGVVDPNQGNTALPSEPGW